MTLTKALKNLYYAITGEAAGKNSCVKVINELADNWPEEFTKAEAELPAVTASNNGAVLKVSSGEWAIGAETVELPAVTASNNGAVLKVSGGKWAIGSETVELPAYTSSDEGAVLTVKSDGTLEWAAIPEPAEATT